MGTVSVIIIVIMPPPPRRVVYKVGREREWSEKRANGGLLEVSGGNKCLLALVIIISLRCLADCTLTEQGSLPADAICYVVLLISSNTEKNQLPNDDLHNHRKWMKMKMHLMCYYNRYIQ